MAGVVHSVKDRLLTILYLLRRRDRLHGFVHGADARQNAIDLFAGEWASAFPPDSGLRAGNRPLFNDPRLEWMARQTPVAGKNILELGPLEGAHTHSLLAMGAARVTAVEANRRAFLKCLVTQSVLHLHTARFACADFMAWLDANPEPFDLCVASGVLYHMRDPLRLLGLICARAEAVYLWTHYDDPLWRRQHPAAARRFGGEVPMIWQGCPATGIRRRYGAHFHSRLHFGGDAGYSCWMKRDDILDALRFFGRRDIVIGFEEPDHPGGAAFALVAR